MYQVGRGMGDTMTAAFGPYFAGSDLGGENQLVSYCSQGRLNWLTAAGCWGRSLDDWRRMALSMVAAAPGAPSGSLLTVPPVSGEHASEVVSALIDRQMVEQQALNAEGIQTTPGWQAASAAVGAAATVGDALPSIPAIPWGTLGVLAGVGILAAVALASGSPRRYGR